jgi:hypothetical protein
MSSWYLLRHQVQTNQFSIPTAADHSSPESFSVQVPNMRYIAFRSPARQPPNINLELNAN